MPAIDHAGTCRGAAHRTRALFVLVASLVVYAAAGLHHISLPGLQQDEAWDALIALDTLHGAPLGDTPSVTLLGHQLPLMSTTHEGPTIIYLSMPTLALAGPSVAALRFLHVMVGLLTLVLLWSLARRWGGARTAAIAVGLTATFPAFVWWTRAGGNWNDPVLPAALGMVLLADRWLETRRPRDLAGALFLGGVGVTTKILFVWMAVPLLLAPLLCLGPVGSWQLLRSVRGRTAIAAGLALAAGLMPMLAYNLSGAGTLRFVAANAVSTQLYGYDNRDIVRNVATQAVGFLRLMGGSTVVFSAPSGWPVGALLFALGLAGMSNWLVRRWRTDRDARATDRALRRRLFLLLTVVTVVPISAVTPTHASPAYLFIIVPFAWLLVAWAVVDGWDALARRYPGRPWAGAAVLVVALTAGNQTVTNVRVATHFDRTGGRGLWSDAVTTLASRVQHEWAGRPVAAMDWGFSRNVAFLTDGHIRPQELYDASAKQSAAVADRCAAWMRDPSALYLFHVPRHTAFAGVRNIFEDTAHRLGRTVTLVEALQDRDGEANTLVFAVQ